MIFLLTLALKDVMTFDVEPLNHYNNYLIEVSCLFNKHANKARRFEWNLNWGSDYAVTSDSSRKKIFFSLANFTGDKRTQRTHNSSGSNRQT